MHAMARALVSSANAVGRGCITVARALLTCCKPSPSLEEPLLARPKTQTRGQASRRYLNKKRTYRCEYMGAAPGEAFIVGAETAFNPFDDLRAGQLPVSRPPEPSVWDSRGNAAPAAQSGVEMAGVGRGRVEQRRPLLSGQSGYF